MKKALIPAFVLVVASTLLGATVLREPVAWAAVPIASVLVTNDESRPVPVREQNLDPDGNIKVHEQGTVAVREQGTASVNVTSATPITSGGGWRETGVHLDGSEGTVQVTPPATASALSIHMNGLVRTIEFRYQGNSVATFPGPLQLGNPIVVLALTRPIRFDSVGCAGQSGGDCTFGWIGAQP
jgi:hypothetical protein